MPLPKETPLAGNKPVSQASPPASTPHEDTTPPILTTDVHLRHTTPAPATPQEPTYGDDDRVTVTCNYGAKDEVSQRFWIGTVRFDKDRIARNVRYAEAKALLKLFAPGIIRIHANDATVPEIMQKCGVRPEPAKVAAMLLASDLDALAAQMSPDELENLAKALRERAIQRGHDTRASRA